MNVRRWSVRLGDRERLVELEHRTWWQRAIVRIDGREAANQSLNLAIGYDRAVDVPAEVDGRRLDVAIRAEGSFRPSYRYSLLVDGAPAPGSDPVGPAPVRSARPTLLGIVEQIIWGSMLIAAVRTLASEHPDRALLVVPAGVVASLVLRRESMPPSWRLLGAILVVVAWITGIAVLTGAYDPPAGI